MLTPFLFFLLIFSSPSIFRIFGANVISGELNVKTVEDLATFKFCVWAEAIVTMSGFEHKLNAAERKVERMAKKLES